jgi:hypothetical protein
MRKTFHIFLFILILVLLSPSLSHAQVQTRLRVFEASNVGTGTDSLSRDMGDQFKSLLSFSSYRLLKEETITLRPGQPAIIPLHAGRSMELMLTGQPRNVAEVRVKIKQSEALTRQNGLHRRSETRPGSNHYYPFSSVLILLPKK